MTVPNHAAVIVAIRGKLDDANSALKEAVERQKQAADDMRNAETIAVEAFVSLWLTMPQSVRNRVRSELDAEERKNEAEETR
jgi:hypothetical protein